MDSSNNSTKYRTTTVEWGAYAENQEEYDALDNQVIFENPWTFWYDQYPGPGLPAEAYVAAMKKVATIGNIQEFWGIFNNLPSLEEIHLKSSYHLMKNEGLPLWEDEANIEGGSLTFRIKKTDSEHVWLYMVLAVIGEQFDDILAKDDEIKGISVNVRAGSEDAVTLWNKRADLINIRKFTEKIRTLLAGVDFLSEVTYRVHRDELNFNSGSNKSYHKSKKGNTSPKRGNSPPKKTPSRGHSPPKHNNNNSYHTPKKTNNHHKEHNNYGSHGKNHFQKNLNYIYVPIISV